MSDKLTILDGRLRVDTCGGPLVLSPKPGGDKPCCCACKQCFCFRSNGINNDGRDCASNPVGARAFKKTIAVPINFSLPVKVVATGFVDDVFCLDNDCTVFGQNPAPFTTPAHDFNYEWIQNNRTFTVETLDTYGGCITLAFNICIMPLDTNPTEECAPTILVDGSRSDVFCLGVSGPTGP